MMTSRFFFSIVLFFSLSSKSQITDIDGNVYKSVQIGTQLWFAENLKTSKYNDGTPIPNIVNKFEWCKLSTGAWCFYNNDKTKNTKHGKLYNWYAINPSSNGNKNVCPIGWHIPTDNEWVQLEDYLGDTVIAGKIKEAGTTSWIFPNKNATNSTGFTARASGYRDFNGDFSSLGYNSFWWTSSEDFGQTAWQRSLNFSDDNSMYREYFGKRSGLSIRCIKD